MALVRVPIYQVLFDEDGYFYIHRFNLLAGEYVRIERSRFNSFASAKATADELNEDQEPITLDLNID